MRIIGGNYSGKKIVAPSNLPVRPTTDFAKEGLFNYLEHNAPVEGKIILDLCAGTGGMSYEFISRGAEYVYAVDINRDCVQFILRTSKEMDFSNFKVLRMDALKFLKSSKIKYDVIFFDPPYRQKSYEKIISTVFEKNLLNPEGVLIAEHDRFQNFEHISQYTLTKTYGNVRFSFFRNIVEPS